MPTISYNIIRTGGAIQFNLSATASGNVSFSRAVYTSGSPLVFTDLYNGPLPPVYLDVGDGTTLPLDQTQQYVYELTDTTGSVQTEPLQPIGSFNVAADYWTGTLIKLLQGGVQTLAAQNPQYPMPRIVHAMPLAGQGTPRLPIITVNMDLGPQQEEIPIGQQNNYSDTNEYQIPAIVMRRWSITVLSSTVEEREFWRDSIIAMFTTILAHVFESAGQNTSHRFQAASSQVVGGDMMPGFYFSEISLEISGIWNVNIVTSYPIITAITPILLNGVAP